MSVQGIINAISSSDCSSLRMHLKENRSLSNALLPVSGRYFKPIEFAICIFKNNIEIVKILLEYGANPNIIINDHEPLVYYPMDFEMLELLIDKGANPFFKGQKRSEFERSLYEATKEDEYAHRCRLFEKAEQKYLKRWEILKNAIMNENLEILKNELKNNFDLNFKDQFSRTPYKYAMENEKIEIASMLKKKKRKAKGGCLGLLFVLIFFFGVYILL